MRIWHRYTSHGKDQRLIEALQRLSVRYKEKVRTYKTTDASYFLEFYLYEDNPRFKELRAEFERYDLAPQIGTEFDREDVAKASWFHINAGHYQYPQPEDDFGYLQATYNLDHHCANCGVGKLQNAPFRLKAIPKQTNLQFWGLHWEFDAIFVRSEAKKVLEDEDIRDISFIRPVLHKKGIEIEDSWQIQIKTQLGEGLNDYNLSTEICEYVEGEETITFGAPPRLIHYCGRTKYNFPQRGGITFAESSFHNMPDMVRSREWFGSGGSARHLPIVSKRFKEIVEKYLLKGLVFTPIVHQPIPS